MRSHNYARVNSKPVGWERQPALSSIWGKLPPDYPLCSYPPVGAGPCEKVPYSWDYPPAEDLVPSLCSNS